jgi:hypothetical protein
VDVLGLGEGIVNENLADTDGFFLFFDDLRLDDEDEDRCPAAETDEM